jgi:hypothetical protein
MVDDQHAIAQTVQQGYMHMTPHVVRLFCIGAAGLADAVRLRETEVALFKLQESDDKLSIELGITCIEGAPFKCWN